MKLQNIKAARQDEPGGGGNVQLGGLRQNSVMAFKSQDRVMQAEYKAQIDAVAKRGLSVLSEDGKKVSEDDGPTEKQKAKNPFWEHGVSSGKFMSIKDPTERRRITYAVTRLNEYCAAHESLLGQGSQMAHSEMISAMLFDEEELVPVPPLLCTTFKKVLVDTGGTKDFRFGVKVYMTNRRLILMDAHVVRASTLEDVLPKEDASFFLRRRHKVEVEVSDKSWYYPVPLSNLKGIALEMTYSTKAAGFLFQRRPVYLIAVCLAAGLILLNYTLAEMYTRTGSFDATYGEVVDNFDAAGDIVNKGQNLEPSELVRRAALSAEFNPLLSAKVCMHTCAEILAAIVRWSLPLRHQPLSVLLRQSLPSRGVPGKDVSAKASHSWCVDCQHVRIDTLAFYCAQQC